MKTELGHLHSYLRHNHLDHYLSKSEIIERNRENNKLNSLGLVLGMSNPVSNGNKFINNNIIGHGEYKPLKVRDIDNLIRFNNIPTDRPVSITGFNTRFMPTAPNHISQSIENTILQ